MPFMTDSFVNLPPKIFFSKYAKHTLENCFAPYQGDYCGVLGSPVVKAGLWCVGELSVSHKELKSKDLTI